MTRTLDSNTTLFAAMMLATALVLAPTSVVAQNADVAGSWALTVETDVGGTTNPSVTLEQNGATLTGHYSSDTLGEAEVTGTVDGNEVSFSFDAEAGGYAIEVSYTGTLQDDGSLSGNMDLGGLGGGTFVGKKQ
jgi:hypothetical protein